MILDSPHPAQLFTKINLKWIKDFYVISVTVKELR